MEEEKIRQLIEEIDPEGKISPDRIESFISAIKENEINPPQDGDSKTYIDENGNEQTIYFNHLKEQMQNETDWRKKASIAAKIISLGLDK